MDEGKVKLNERTINEIYQTMDWVDDKCEDYTITSKREAKVSRGKGWEKAWNMNHWEDDKQK